ncbi:hypothetical protein GCM10007920_15870 [Ciceribacter naphthalenivorans]|uniref:DUF3426 domain-containing protein n=2 Tax=Alphaproteobacteria TaxID=28211 RepID=A0A512HLJ5_9HYPH|nr:hypothetical protein RNA01_32500 [Ciceribacter naphthalenivorans]GLR21800.1 hypothetical protein GCM10007920_15870 [Ciceribacter naphthalenivorans]GLT04656.1 hypothetical protein GCM10007926_15870 [Sphingomonas psychrolutea]
MVDAHYVAVDDAPRRAQASGGLNDNRRRAPAERRAFDTSHWVGLAGGSLRSTERVLQTFSERGFALFVALAFVVTFAFAGLIVRAPDAEAYVRPLDITHVSLTPRDADGMRILQVNAIIENRSAARSHVPKLRADLIAGGQIIASTYIATPVDEIDAGHSRGITARLLHPGGKTPELRLSFEETGA